MAESLQQIWLNGFKAYEAMLLAAIDKTELPPESVFELRIALVQEQLVLAASLGGRHRKFDA